MGQPLLYCQLNGAEDGVGRELPRRTSNALWHIERSEQTVCENQTIDEMRVIPRLPVRPENQHAEIAGPSHQYR